MQASEEDMAEMLGFSSWEFTTTMINMLSIPIDKADNMQKNR